MHDKPLSKVDILISHTKLFLLNAKRTQPLFPILNPVAVGNKLDSQN